jgi:ketosteroid isomerase-like protein
VLVIMPRLDEAIVSQENEALVRLAVEAYHQADTARLLELVHPDLEWTYLNPEDPDPQPQVCHGRDQIAWALDHQARQGVTPEVEEIISFGDKVMVVARTPGADQRRAWRNGDRNILVLTVAGGRISAMRAFRDRDQACRFAGLDKTARQPQRPA